MTFESLMSRWAWRPIRNCPGRYVLSGVPAGLSPFDLMGADAEIPSRHFHVAAARDLVVVTPLDTGGLISYHRADGTWLHTLNTPEGFARKLQQLGIMT